MISDHRNRLGRLTRATHLEQNQWDDAEPHLRELLNIREMTEPDAWTTFNTQSLLGEALLGLKIYTDAEPLLLKGYEGMKDRADELPNPIHLQKALEQLVRLYEETSDQDAFAMWNAALAESQANLKMSTPPDIEKSP